MHQLAKNQAAATQAINVAPGVARIKAATELPVIAGFGIRTPETARSIASVDDGAVVGSAIVKMVEQGKPVPEILAFIKNLSDGAHSA